MNERAPWPPPVVPPAAPWPAPVADADPAPSRRSGAWQPEEPRPEWWRLVLVVAGLGLVAVRWPWVSLAIVALIVMIFLHEVGHFVTARRTGMKATQFFLGVGPKIWSFRRGEVEYGLKAIPIGAYVRIIGMTRMEEVDPADEGRTYRQQSFPRRLLVVCAGSLMHFLLAVVAIFGVLVGFGVEKADVWRIGQLSQLVQGQTPAQAAGLQLGDRIVAVDGTEYAAYPDVVRAIRAAGPGASVQLTVERDGTRFDTSATLVDGHVLDPRIPPNTGFLGIRADFPLQPVPVAQAVPRTFSTFGEIVWQSVTGIGRLFSPGGLTNYVESLRPGQAEPVPGGTGAGGGTTIDENRPTSIIGTVQIASRAAEEGFATFLFFFAAVNIFIGTFNLIPLLPFDGGHAAIAVYERIREIGRGGRRYFADVTKMLPFAYGVLALLAFIVITAMIRDVVDPLQLPR